jgi:hypothetical protein
MHEAMSWEGVPCPHEPATSKTLKKIIEKKQSETGRILNYWVTALLRITEKYRSHCIYYCTTKTK